MWHLTPRDDKFFDLFKESVSLVNQGADEFLNLLVNYDDLELYLQRINKIESATEAVTQKIIQNLEDSYITPMDREDIYSLAKRIRNIIGIIQATVDRLKLYRLGKPNQDINELVKLLRAAVFGIKKTINCMVNMRSNYNEIVQTCELVNNNEHIADEYYRNGLARLFDEIKEPIEVIKWKEIFGHLEKAIDNCKEVADQLKEVAIKYA